MTTDHAADLEKIDECLVGDELPVDSGGFRIPLRLRRLPPSGHGQAAGAVVILHGGNSSSDTFLMPSGGLAVYLNRKGWDVWLLDWRGSPYVTPRVLAGPPLGGSAAAECAIMNLDRAAEEDVPQALAAVRKEIGDDVRLSLMGHCLGAGVVAMAIARRHITRYRVRNFVLATMGLFYEVPWDGWVKVEDFILERIASDDRTCRSVDPRKPELWPDVMKSAYRRWPEAWLVPGESSTDELLRRISFMVGKPWSPDRLAPGLHGPAIEPVFGPMHLGIYLQSGQLVRRGFSARFGQPDVIDRSRLAEAGGAAAREGIGLVHDLVPSAFDDMAVTLVGAGENRVWHRDAMDLMYEWLCSNAPPRAPGRPPPVRRFAKHVLPGYNLQELFWGANAREDVYPLIEQGLRAYP